MTQARVGFGWIEFVNRALVWLLDFASSAFISLDDSELFENPADIGEVEEGVIEVAGDLLLQLSSGAGRGYEEDDEDLLDQIEISHLTTLASLFPGVPEQTRFLQAVAERFGVESSQLLATLLARSPSTGNPRTIGDVVMRLCELLGQPDVEA